jgi:hypothetical protein
MDYTSFFLEPNTKYPTNETILSPEPITPNKYIIAFDRFQIRGEKFGQYLDRYLLLADDWLHIYLVKFSLSPPVITHNLILFQPKNEKKIYL